MSAYSNAPYGFGFAPDPFSKFVSESDSESPAHDELDGPEQLKEPRYGYGALHSAIKRNREWFR